MIRTLLVCAVFLAPRALFAQERGPFSIFGGRLIGHGEDAISAGLGWPGAFAEYDTGVSPSFDLGVRADLFWGSPTTSPRSLFETHLGGGVSAPIRLELSESGRIGLALGLRPGVYLGAFTGSRGARFGDDATGLGLLLEPSVRLTIAATGSTNVVAGCGLPVFVLFVPDADTTELFFPIIPFLGLEIGLADDVNAFVLGSFGPGIHVHEPEAGLESALEARLGIEYLL